METETIVTAEQRQKEIKSREDLHERAARRTQEEKEKLIGQLSVRDRLMRRLHHKTFKTILEDDLGEFIIETRLMTSTERLEALKFNEQLRKSEGNVEEYGKAMSGFKSLVKEICATPGLEEYWDSGESSDDVVVSVIMNALYGSIEAVGDSVGSFRKK